MYKFSAAIFAVFGLISLFAGLVLLISITGAFMGWVVGLVFPNTMQLLADMLRITAEPWQLGLIFGFVGSFLKSSFSVKK